MTGIVGAVITTLAMIWLAWEMLFRSGLQWGWFRRPRLHGKPVMAVRVTVSFSPEAGRFRRLPFIPERDPYDWIWRWMWFSVSWVWITQSGFQAW
jgi:hypothetical protein